MTATRTDGGAVRPTALEPVQRVIDRLNRTGCDPRPVGVGKWESVCPAHKGGRRNLSIAAGIGGAVLLRCHHVDDSGRSCSAADIVSAIDLELRDLFVPVPGTKRSAPAGPKKKPTGTGFDSPRQASEFLGKKLGAMPSGHWVYRDADEAAYAVVYRFDLADGKSYRPVSLDPAKGLWKIGDPPSWLPYRLPELGGVGRVFLLEGEKVAELARGLGLAATTTAHGAKSPHKTDLSALSGMEVVIIPDVGSAGEGYAAKLLERLGMLEPRPRIRLLRLDLAEDGDDLEQWMEARGGATAEAIRSELEALVETIPPVDLDVGTARTRSAPEAPTNGIHPPGDGNGRAGPRPVGGDELPVNEAPDDPHRLARAVLAEFRHRDGPTLAWYRETFHVWDGSAYRPDPALPHRIVKLVKAEIDRQNRSALEAHREKARTEALAATLGRPSNPPIATRVTRRLIADVVQALASMTCIDQEPDAPFWIDPRPGDPAPAALMPASNGLVGLDAGESPPLLSHSPRFFSTYALPYSYNPSAGPPAAWLKFLDDLWGDDPASVRELQKWFGYTLTPQTDQQKVLLLIGSPRSGRGTIRKVLTAVVGARNVSSTSAVALADRFGLEPLIGKTLAVMGDARTGDTHDAAVMMDRLLRISGEDPVEVNRKGKPILHDVQMKVRFVILSNEMPNFRDSSKAIVSRYLALCTPRSFEDCEDRSLDRKLLQELPGILNWAIAGRAMLAAAGRFITPATAEDLIDDAKALASPVSEFVAERCKIDPDEEVTIDAVWCEWKLWAAGNGHQPGHKHLFGRNLKAATRFKIRTKRENNDGVRTRIYEGISLNKDAPGF